MTARISGKRVRQIMWVPFAEGVRSRPASCCYFDIDPLQPVCAETTQVTGCCAGSHQSDQFECSRKHAVDLHFTPDECESMPILQAPIP